MCAIPFLCAKLVRIQPSFNIYLKKILISSKIMCQRSDLNVSFA